MARDPCHTPASFNAIAVGTLPGELGVAITEIGDGMLRAEMTAGPRHLAPNGYLHAASIIALADTACGYACIAHLPEGAESFTTIELKSNFLSTVRSGLVTCEAKAVHLGRATQVWEARVMAAATGKLMAVFSCTQMVLMKRSA